MKKTCPGCIHNTQRIMVLENRVSYIEQNMMGRSSTPLPRGRSRSKKRSRSRPKKVSEGGDAQPPKTVGDIQKQLGGLRITTLPEYIPPQQVSSANSSLDPIAPSFHPRTYYPPSYGPVGPDGGSSGYQ